MVSQGGALIFTPGLGGVHLAAWVRIQSPTVCRAFGFIRALRCRGDGGGSLSPRRLRLGLPSLPGVRWVTWTALGVINWCFDCKITL
jgi:hypothetical protein